MAWSQATSPQPQPEVLPAAPGQEPLPPPQGTVIIQSHGEPPAEATTPETTVTPSVETRTAPNGDDPLAAADLSDAGRSALQITAYDLDLRLRPSDSALSARAQLAVTNTAATPLSHLALQVSSTLQWNTAVLLEEGRRTPVPWSQHRLDTDADHTGAETELVLTLPHPLAPGASAHLDLFYSGTVAQNAGRLARLGANAGQQESTDWDAVSPTWTGLRGFGNVLWYPVASPQLFLGDGNALFQAVGETRLREQGASVRLRLSVEYTGEPPVAAYFCGRRAALTAVADTPDVPVASAAGIASATFATEPLGFRTPSLFLLNQPEIFADQPGSATPSADADPGSSSLSSSSSAQDAAEAPAPAVQPLLRRASGLNTGTDPFLAIGDANPETVGGFTASAYKASALLREWLGPQPLSALTALEHNGQPFEDGPLLVAPLGQLAASAGTAALVQTLTHAWVQSGQPWMDEGLAQFFALLWTERQVGRGAALADLAALMQPVAFREPDPSAAKSTIPLEPLIDASSELIYRRKAAAVWWMLRGLVGDGTLHAALSAWRVQPPSQDPPAKQAEAFQHLLERLSHQDLGWFFQDWVFSDKGLPDLSIQDVAVAEEPTSPTHAGGFLVALTVRNTGGAVADVPVTIDSGATATTRRLRVAGQSTVTERILVERAPTSVTVNDGSTPEQQVSTHTSVVHVSNQ